MLQRSQRSPVMSLLQRSERSQSSYDGDTNLSEEVKAAVEVLEED